MQRLALWVSALSLAPMSGVFGQAKYPDWPYPKSYDSVKAAPQNNKVLFENNKLRLIEVMIRPGEKEKMSGQPYPSVYMYDAPVPDMPVIHNVVLDPNSALNGQGAGHGAAPSGLEFPTCDTLAPLAPHELTNNGDFPIHYYRLEFKRVDGAGLAANWKTWYPWMLGPIPTVKNLDPAALGPPFSKEWPYPLALDSVAAAPNNHKALYVDQHVRLVEVTERGESQENLHGHPYYSIFINDAVAVRASRGGQARAPDGRTPLGTPGPYHKGEVGDYQLDPSQPTMRTGKLSGPPAGMVAPSCSSATPQAPHAHINGGDVPGHFYRFEFLRVDGDGIKNRWREWYP